nr:unnamed protein product [Callosobruchus analis]
MMNGRRQTTRVFLEY